MDTKKSKKQENAATDSREVRAVAKYVRTAPRKLRLVIDIVRGKEVKDALTILKFTPQRAARVLEKVLNSAVANAENNFRMDKDNLYVYRAYIDPGPTMKRWIPRAQGRASAIHKRTSHITFVVKESKGVK